MPLIILRIIVREIAILAACLAVFPAVAIVIAHFGDIPVGRLIVGRDFIPGAAGTGPLWSAWWFRLVSPYLLVQSIRAFLWSQRTVAGRRWANLYFAFLLLTAGGWSLWTAWDLFQLMYSLGDMPAELKQFLELEGYNLIIGCVAIGLAFACILIFLDPLRGPAGRPRRGP